LNRSVASATTIVIARLDQYIAEPESVDRMVEEKFRSSSGMAIGNVEGMVMRTVQPRGTYAFTVLGTLKGKPPQPLVVRLPRVTRYGFGVSSSDPQIPLMGTYLLLLSGSETAGFTPTGLAPMPISGKVVLPKEPIVADSPDAMMSAVMRLFVESMADPVMRHAAAYLISGAVNDEAYKALRVYADDPDDGLRMNALTSMATNQDVTAIPKIAAWHYNTPGRSGAGPLDLFQKYKTPEAIPYLNDLLLDKTSPYIPLNAAMALRQLPLDKSSIPYWMVALYDTEQQGIAAFDAYWCLHKMIPELGEPQNMLYFRGNRAEETRKLEDWWADEQAGKHKQP